MVPGKNPDPIMTAPLKFYQMDRVVPELAETARLLLGVRLEPLPKA